MVKGNGEGRAGYRRYVQADEVGQGLVRGNEEGVKAVWNRQVRWLG